MVKSLLSRFREDWDRFFFTTIAAETFTGYRVAFALYLFCYFLTRQWTLFFFYGPSGVVESGLSVPAHLPLQLSVFHCFWPHTGSIVLPLYVLTLALIVCFGLGHFTRIAAVGLWLATASWLNPLVVGFSAADHMVRIQTFLVALAAVSGCFQPKRKNNEIWPLRLMQLQVVAIYFYSALFKLAFPEWRQGKALANVLGDELFARHDFSWLIAHPALTGALTYGTLAFELAIFPLLVWPKRTRRVVLAAGLLFHLFIALTMKVNGFFAAMAMFYLAFLTADEWKWLVKAVKARAPKKGLLVSE